MSIETQKNSNMSRNKNDDSLEKVSEAVEEVGDANLAMSMELTDTEEQNGINLSGHRKICPDTELQPSQKEEETPSTNKVTATSSSSLEDSIKFAAEMMVRLDSILQRIPTSFEDSVQLYLQRKTKILMTDKFEYEHAGVYQESTDFFPANEQSVILFRNFYRTSRNVLWVEVGPFRHICQICKYVIKYRKSLYEHLNLHYEHYHICKICKRKMASPKGLRNHYKSKHYSTKN